MLRYILLLVVASIVPNAFAGVADDETLTRIVVFCRQLYFDKASNNYVYSVDNQKIKYLYNITKKNIYSRYPKADANKLYAQAIAHYVADKPSVGIQKQVSTCRSLVDTNLNAYAEQKH